MTDEDVLLITGRQVDAALAGRHRQIADAVRAAYQARSRHQDALPQAGILRFADDPRNRVIALPARVDVGTERAGMKWIASFPANTARGLERASAVIMLNSLQTGRVTTVMEGSLISAKRTAASAAVAAAEVHRAAGPSTLGLIGCGRINFEILQFIRAVGPEVDAVLVFDQDPARAEGFAERCADVAPELKVAVAASIAETLAASPLVSFATTAIEPHVSDLSMCPAGATILHISLRDIAPREILLAENLVDDVEHACAAQTSVHLAEQLVGHRDFIRATLGDVLLGRVRPRAQDNSPLIFSPFGMGTLDIAVAGLVLDTVQDAVAVPDFWPAPWNS
ncbi:MAG: 2,3-diaminopropionate biosynthesis protein SbnB [Catenulispora sp.]|nr:2,3-diaminopropionate biosynthesis protein SbnB [Catenulispora sp.]